MEIYFIILGMLGIIFSVMTIVKFEHEFFGFGLLCLSVGFILATFFWNAGICRWAIEWTDVMLLKMLISSVIWGLVVFVGIIVLVCLLFLAIIFEMARKPAGYDTSDFEA